MRRTTICRSERAALLALVAGLLAGLAPALAAQDTTQARPDTSKPAQDTSQAAPAPAPLGQLPATHVVATGETLWSIAQLYYNDPLLWPEIYRLNTSQIDDPHWIYPGQELGLAPGVSVAQAPETTTVMQPQGPGDTVHAVPAPDTVVAVGPDTSPLLDTALVEAPPPPAEPTEGYQTIFDRRRTATQEVRDVLRAYANQPYRPLRRGEFYAAGFLTEQERLPYGRVLGNTSIPAIPRLTDRSTATTFDQISVQPPRGASYHVGDSLLIVRIDRDITGWGGVVVPVGVARVTELQRRQVLADVIMQFGRIHDGHLALPLEPFKDPGEVHPTPVDGGLEGVVIAERDLHVLAGRRPPECRGHRRFPSRGPRSVSDRAGPVRTGRRALIGTLRRPPAGATCSGAGPALARHRDARNRGRATQLFPRRRPDAFDAGPVPHGAAGRKRGVVPRVGRGPVHRAPRDGAPRAGPAHRARAGDPSRVDARRLVHSPHHGQRVRPGHAGARIHRRRPLPAPVPRAQVEALRAAVSVVPATGAAGPAESPVARAGIPDRDAGCAARVRRALRRGRVG